ncbi:Crp/Fnr family transcriptional regulator [Spirosoma sp. RP8]|uniref:Crp/Fnr family transcriptional regulator n=1 Tax=Spirosoma liriopis TaxID=2937440 RepID=A0ABT0HPP8_9BACT|nr:Crp/Fnr family transcriptional regulator [Spirosoma liriopis]MCK8494143.1 Crp/Fnr family transcriptional regulator [Spirosoma liriopis]
MEKEALKATVFRTMPLLDEEWEAFAACWHPVHYKRKTLLTSAGAVEHYLYFVQEGVQRAFYMDDASTETTLVFSYTGSFAGVVDSFQLQQPSRYYLETLTASYLLRISYADFTRLLDTHPNLERWVRLATAQALSGVLQRQIELATCSAEEKFRILLTRSPQVLQLIPQKYLASYLGIDPATFSKLLKSVRV